jgi:UDP-N-acetylglucosamine diphosphorylase/glucosamine-1-phosphate N-acetyltransferase
MRNIILFDDDNWRSLLPITFTRPVGDIRIGILTMAEKWTYLLGGSHVSYITQDHLSAKFPAKVDVDNLLINSACLPTEQLISFAQNLNLNESLTFEGELIAARLDKIQFENLINNDPADEIKSIDVSHEKNCIVKISHPYEIFSNNGNEIQRDFNLITKGRVSAELSSSNKVFGSFPIFLEEGVVAECSIFNTTEGPIYLGKNSIVMEGAMIRGPFGMGEKSIIKMGAKIYSHTSAGPGCKIGGEVNNVVFQANSSKAHDGYLGNSVIGEWCNIGAGSNSSNLKNNYDEIKLWSYPTERFEKTGLQFCGLIFGDHSKCAIDTQFNTGTVVGVNANIFGSGFPRNFIPSFSWGGNSGFSTYEIKKAIETAERVMARRHIKMSQDDVKILEYTFFESSRYRTWE